MSLIPLILIPALYFAVALLKPYFEKTIPFRICAICLAVSLTWLGLLPLFFLGKIEAEPIAILMGMSVTGIMYKFEEVFKQHKLKNFWFVRVILIIGGFYLIYSVLERNWNLVTLLAILMPISILISSLLFQERKKSRLEDCC